MPIKDILDEVGVQAGADALLSTSEDGWTCGTPLDALTDGRDALLALTMNGEPLPVPHGFPVRQVVPGLYGYVSATKWVTDWEITRFQDFQAYWTQRGWGPSAGRSRPRRASTCRAAPPRPARSRSPVSRGSSASASAASRSGSTAAPWQQATLAKVPNVDTWVQWTWQWDADKGDHTIEARATNTQGRAADRGGRRRPARRRDGLPRHQRHGHLSATSGRCPRGAPCSVGRMT